MLGSKLATGLILGLLHPVLGTPTPSTIDITFDERKVVPGVPALNAVGNEKGVFFNSWVINQNLNTPVSGLLTHSPFNEIVTAAEQQEFNSTAYISPVSPYKTLDLYSFYFGIAANTAEGVASAALEGTILVAGFVGTKEVAVATYTFTPKATQTTAAPMIFAELPSSFRRLTKVTFSVGDPAVQVIAADDFVVALDK